jgi:nucleoside-diphosphate-sugar epimerase
MLRFLVTGGAGFIGSNLVEELHDLGEVSVIDDLSTGDIENIELLVDKGVNFIEASILDNEKLVDVSRGIDYIFHQAALPSVSRSIDDPVKSNLINVSGTLNVLEAARKNHVKKVVYASSSAVYGDTVELPISESMKPNPLSPLQSANSQQNIIAEYIPTFMGHQLFVYDILMYLGQDRIHTQITLRLYLSLYLIFWREKLHPLMEMDLLPVILCS